MRTEHWERAIILLDMDSFFASVEELDNPNVSGGAISVTNGLHGNTIITCSYKARQHGIHTGMPLYKARNLCPDLINFPARHKRYSLLSNAIMSYIRTNTSPEMEVFSIDEAFIDITKCQANLGSVNEIATKLQRGIYEKFGLKASLGVSGDKTTAKHAAKLAKPYGMKIVKPTESAKFLANVAVIDICGIATKTADFLATHNVYKCADMKKISKEVLTQKYGATGARIWYMCQGLDPSNVMHNYRAAKTMGHSKILPPNTKDNEIILYYFAHMVAKLMHRMRVNGFYADHFLIAMRSKQKQWFRDKVKITIGSNSQQDLMQLVKAFMKQNWSGDCIVQVQVTALHLRSAKQIDILDQDSKVNKVNRVIDAINAKYNNACITYARIITPID